MRQLLSRASILRGRFRDSPAPIRPPWSLDEPAFTAACERCDACRLACPEEIIVAGAGGYPVVDFDRGECTFCGRCAGACEAGAFRRNGAAPWQILAQIGTDCLSLKGVVCRLCEEQCEARAIRFSLAPRGVALPEVDAAACSGCGACVSACPSHAISIGEIQP